MTKDFRQAFEEWYLKDDYSEFPGAAVYLERAERLFERDGNGYILPGVYRAWMVWQAAFQAGRASIPAPEVTDEMVDIVFMHMETFVDQMDEHSWDFDDLRQRVATALQAALGGSHE